MVNTGLCRGKVLPGGGARVPGQGATYSSLEVVLVCMHAAGLIG